VQFDIAHRIRGNAKTTYINDLIVGPNSNRAATSRRLHIPTPNILRLLLGIRLSQTPKQRKLHQCHTRQRRLTGQHLLGYGYSHEDASQLG
jgi:hypothetical protein